MVVRKIKTNWPVAEYAIVTIGHGYGLFRGHKTLLWTSYNLSEVESKLNTIIRGEV